MKEIVGRFWVQKMENITERACSIYLNLPRYKGDDTPRDVNYFLGDRNQRVENYLEDQYDLNETVDGEVGYWQFAERSLSQFKANYIAIATEISEDGFPMKEAELFTHFALWSAKKSISLLEGKGTITKIDIERIGSEESCRYVFASALGMNAMEALCIAESACLPRFDLKKLFRLTEARDSEYLKPLDKESLKPHRVMVNKKIAGAKRVSMELLRRKVFSAYLDLREQEPAIYPSKAMRMISDIFLEKDESKILCLQKKRKLKEDSKVVTKDTSTLLKWVTWFSDHLSKWKEFAIDDGVYIESKEAFIDYVVTNFTLHNTLSPRQKLWSPLGRKALPMFIDIMENSIETKRSELIEKFKIETEMMYQFIQFRIESRVDRAKLTRLLFDVFDYNFPRWHENAMYNRIDLESRKGRLKFIRHISRTLYQYMPRTLTTSELDKSIDKYRQRFRSKLEDSQGA